MAQDILITPQASLPKIEYTGSGGGAATITQQILADSRMQFTDGSVLFEINPVANEVSATKFYATSSTAGFFIGDGSNLTNVTAEWDGSHTGAATITGSLLINGTGTLTATTGYIPNMNVGNLDVSGTATIDGAITINGSGNFFATSRTLNIATVNASTQLSSVSVRGVLVVGTTGAFPTLNGGNLDVSGTATIDGILTLNSNLKGEGRTAWITNTNVGVLDVSGAATVDGNINLGGQLKGEGKTAFITNMNVGVLDVSGAATVDGILTLNNNLKGENRTAWITNTNVGTLDVSGNAVVDGTLRVVGNVSGASFYGDGSNLTNIAAGTIDHGVLSGLTDSDDHTQYIYTTPGTSARNTITAGGGAGLVIKGPTVPVSDQILFLVEQNGGSDLFSIDVEGDAILAGSFKANSKSFLIDHPDPAKVGWKLQYTCLEGPENGVYTRGRSQSCCIDLPDHWPHLVHEDSLSVHITPFGNSQMTLKVSEIRDNKVFVEAGNLDDPIDFFYIVYATRKDIPLLVIEHEPVEDGK